MKKARRRNTRKLLAVEALKVTLANCYCALDSAKGRSSWFEQESTFG